MSETWKELPGAIVRTYRDEVALDQKKGHTDTIKLRLGSWLPIESGYFGAISFDFLTGDPNDPRREEKLMIKAAHDDIPGHMALGRFPVFQLMGQDRLGTSDDATMRPWLTVCSQGIFPHVPIWGLSAPSDVPGNGNGFPKRIRLRHSVTGKYLCGDLQFRNAPAYFNRDDGGPWEEFVVEIVE